MSSPDNRRNTFRMTVDVSIENTFIAAGRLIIREDVQIAPVGFQEMAAILEAFHRLVEKYRADGPEERR